MEKTAREYFVKHKREILIFGAITLVVLSVALYVFVIEGGGAPFAPEEFTDPRERLDSITMDLLLSVAEATRNINKISDKYEGGDIEGALRKVELEKERHGEIVELVEKLPGNIESMMEALPEIRPRAARVAASSALVKATLVAQSMVKFGNLFDSIIYFLEEKINGAAVDSQLMPLEDQINLEIQTINVLSSEYTTLMEEFDGIMQPPEG